MYYSKLAQLRLSQFLFDGNADCEVQLSKKYCIYRKTKDIGE